MATSVSVATKQPVKTLEEMVDELGDLEKELMPLRPKMKRADDLRSEIRSRYDEKPEDKSFSIEGDRFALNVGARKIQKHVNIAKLYKSVKLSVFLKIVGVTLTSLKEHCEEYVVDSVISEQQTGYRPLELTEKGQPA